MPVSNHRVSDRTRKTILRLIGDLGVTNAARALGLAENTMQRAALATLQTEGAVMLIESRVAEYLGHARGAHA